MLIKIFIYLFQFIGIDTQFAFMDGLAGAIEDEFHGTDIKLFNFNFT